MKTDNELIAEFMGAKVYTDWCLYLDNTYYKFKHGKPTNDSPLTFEEIEHNRVIEQTAIWNPKYDTSWDWLMPVLKKIDSLHSRFPREVSEISEYGVFAEIGIVHEAVVEFIKWYNSQQP